MYKNQCQSNIQKQQNKQQLMNPFVREDSKSDSKNESNVNESNFTDMAISTLEAMKKANKEG